MRRFSAASLCFLVLVLDWVSRACGPEDGLLAAGFRLQPLAMEDSFVVVAAFVGVVVVVVVVVVVGFVVPVVVVAFVAPQHRPQQMMLPMIESLHRLNRCHLRNGASVSSEDVWSARQPFWLSISPLFPHPLLVPSCDRRLPRFRILRGRRHRHQSVFGDYGLRYGYADAVVVFCGLLTFSWRFSGASWIFVGTGVSRRPHPRHRHRCYPQEGCWEECRHKNPQTL